MLVVTRRTKEKIIIRNDIRLTILGIKGNQVRVGIDAPLDISVHREEVFLKIKNGLNKDGTLKFEVNL